MKDQTTRKATPSTKGRSRSKTIKPISKALDTSDAESRVLAFMVASPAAPVTLSQLAADGRHSKLRIQHAGVQASLSAPPSASEPFGSLVVHVASMAEDIKCIADHLVPPPLVHMDSAELAMFASAARRPGLPR